MCSATPEYSLSNEEISKIVETSDEWIITRTGIKQRKITNQHIGITDLASQAAKKAIKNAKIESKDIDLIILATSSPDDLFGNASQIQYKIGAINAAAFDVTAACSGFVISLITGAQFINSGLYKTILIIGADVLSKWVDWYDRKTCILFGDGAGAVILQSSKENRILASSINTDGSQNHQLSLKCNSIISNSELNLHHRYYNFIEMNGKEVYKFAVSKLPSAIEQCIKSANLTIQDIDWLVLHQANERIINTVAEKLCIPNNKIINNLDKYGNTSAASIPLALDEAIEKQQIKINDNVIMAGFGAGFTWSVVILKWG
uniref:Beta-ketoacyl-[acyl-carrier-protein] synthase III n=1 Tax=Rhodochaete parvula TaxID=110510 RepID=A0A220T0S8_9RHOD|nr:3-oxoacyl-acyl-carrier-protein synthase 3 [Rhodochaete parvula]